MTALLPPLSAQPIDREQLRQRLRASQPWDAVIIGGGATGLGIAVDAAQRGLRVALIEARDFASGTSSRSTKLIHGGVRYLAQGNVKLVREALAERAVLLNIAPHLVHPLEFVVPCYQRGEQPFLRLGLGLYDLLAGERSIGATRSLSIQQTLALLPTVRKQGLRGGVSYWDAQFDDALLAIALMQTAFVLGATPINYMRCESLELKNGEIAAVVATDVDSGEQFRLATRCVFNATGVWADQIRKLADSKAASVITPSQGTHIVLDAEWLPRPTALLVPKTRDGRVLFAVPWHGRVLVGTTDQARDDTPFEPQATDDEINFLLATASQYLESAPQRADIRSVFTGLRPLYSLRHANGTAALSREHAVLTEHGGLISIVGGKWTTYRRMASDALVAAAKAQRLPQQVSRTDQLPLVNDPVLQASVEQVRSASFAQHCQRFTLATSTEDVLWRRARLGLLGQLSSAR